MAPRPDSFWLGYLATTVALSTTSTNPQPLLKATLRDFLDDRRETPLGEDVRRMIREGKR